MGAQQQRNFQKNHEKNVATKEVKQLKLDYQTILDFYLKEIRPLTEHDVVVWNSGLTKNQSNDLEKIQKVAFKIILGENISPMM